MAFLFYTQRRKLVWGLVVCISSLNTALSQVNSDTTLYHVETKDGKEFIGRLILRNDSISHFRTTELGELIILNNSIREIKALKAGQLVHGKYWHEIRHASYFLLPFSYGPKKGQVYYQNAYIFINQIIVGASDRFSIGGGFTPVNFSAVGGAVNNGVASWLNLKANYPIVRNKIMGGANIIIGHFFGNENTSFGATYGFITLGNIDKNISGGYGRSYGARGWGADFLTLSGIVRFGAKSYLISENYLREARTINILGVKLTGRRTVFTIGAMLLDRDAQVIPWLSFTLKIGKK
jgi:hypothetical protein